MGKQIHVNPIAPHAHYPRWLVILAWGSVGLTVMLLFGVYPLTGGDLLMHLTVGRWIWTHGAVPWVDNFSYLTAGGPFVAHSWLSEVLFYGVERHSGTVGFMVLRCLLISTAVVLAVRTAFLMHARLSVIMLFLPLILGVLWGRLEFRPQLFTTVCLAVELWLLVSVHTGRRSARWLWALPPMYALWINLHPGWPQGLIIVVSISAAVVGMHVRQRWIDGEGISRLPLRLLIGVGVACVLALLLNPYGLRLLYFPMEMQAAWIRAQTLEWQSPFVLTAWGEGGGGRVQLAQGLFVIAWGLAVRRCAQAVMHWRTADLVPVAVIALGVGLSSYHVRTVSDMTLLTAPLLAAGLHPYRGASRAHRDRGQGRTPMLVGSGLLLTMTAFMLWSLPRDLDWSWTREEPPCAVAAVARLGQPVRVWGQRKTQWLLYRLPHLVKIHYFWEFVAGQAHAEAIRAIWTGQASLAAHLTRYGVDIIILNTGMFRNVPGLRAMGWTLTHLDDRVFLMMRASDPRATPAYHLIRPWENAPVTAEQAPQVLAEADRALEACPDGATFAWVYKARALREMGREEESFEAALKIPARLVLY
jgi:hypothetical protein